MRKPVFLWLSFLLSVPLLAQAASQEQLMAFVYSGAGLGLSAEQIEVNLTGAGYAKHIDKTEEPAGNRRFTLRRMEFAKSPQGGGRHKDEITVRLRDGIVENIKFVNTTPGVDVAAEKQVFIDALGEPSRPCQGRGGMVQCQWKAQGSGIDIMVTLDPTSKDVKMRRSPQSIIKALQAK